VRPAQKNARQPLLAERKLPTTDNKDEMRFEKSLKKSSDQPLISYGFSGSFREGRLWNSTSVGLEPACRKACTRATAGGIALAPFLRRFNTHRRMQYSAIICCRAAAPSVGPDARDDNLHGRRSTNSVTK
jgi:hypothetical protein